MSKTVRGRHNVDAPRAASSGASSPKSGNRRRADKPASDTSPEERASVPSTLDPRLDEEAEQIEEELEERDERRHQPPEDEVPEEDIGEIERAAESLPADTPVDRADRTDEREEHPPPPSHLRDKSPDETPGRQDLDEDIGQDVDEDLDGDIDGTITRRP